MGDNLSKLIERARTISATAAELEEQRRSFAYGNAAFENPDITRQMIDEQAERLKAKND